MAASSDVLLYRGGRPLCENERVAIWEDVFQPGVPIGPHRHERDYIVVCLNAGHLTVRDASGETQVHDVEAGEAVYVYVEPGVHEHTAVHEGPDPHREITIELKARPLPRAD